MQRPERVAGGVGLSLSTGDGILRVQAGRDLGVGAGASDKENQQVEIRSLVQPPCFWARMHSGLSNITKRSLFRFLKCYVLQSSSSVYTATH